MGHLKINCDSCGGNWVVYHRDDWKDWRARTCPTCGQHIDAQTWERSVLRAFGEIEDANLELVKDHTQAHGALFTVDYVSDVIFPNKGNTEEINQLREEIGDLKDETEGLRKITKKLIDNIF